MERQDLRRTFKLRPYEKAIRQLRDATQIEPLDSEEVDLEHAIGRVLASDIISEVNIPRENHAVFDGYAVRSADTLGISLERPVALEIVGKTFPGEVRRNLASGQAVFTACGAPIPRGGDAVVKAENVRLLGDKIELGAPVEPGESVAPAGEDVEKGRRILRKGRFVRPQDVGLLAGVGMRSVRVITKPKVGIVSVGDELVELQQKEPDKIANNYALIVSGLVAEVGATPHQFGIVPDRLDQIKETISRAVEYTHVVTTISGCSVGPKDLVPDAIAAVGDPGLVFHGVQLSPGKVMGAGIVKGKPVVMLPGHIVSTYAGFFLLVAPLIARYLGVGNEFPFPIVRARLSERVKAKPIDKFLRVLLINKNGEFMAEPIRGGSSVLHTLVNSNGYTIVPRGKELKKGAVVTVVLYGKYEFTHIMGS